MSPYIRSRPTIGFLSTWSVYEGTTIDSYTHTLLQGIYAAVNEHDCNLLAGCGIALPGSPRGSRTAWPVPGERADFVPVGPWNCDGLIIIPDDLTPEQFDYVQDLIRSGFPVILTTAEKAGPLIAVDNASGIRQAFDHLLQHGHRQIAFIAGKSGRGGDSAERLAAYRQALRDAGLPEDERLIAFGEHRREDGRLAMEQILRSGAPFSALIASNDLSALGAMEVLRAAGRRIPEDVAVIGFDDILEARSQLPPLTTVRHPTFTLGYQAVMAILQALRGEKRVEENRRVPTRLVIRQSCGCRPDRRSTAAIPAVFSGDLDEARAVLADWMAETAISEARQSRQEEIHTLSRAVAGALTDSLVREDTRPFDDQLQNLYRWLETRPEDVYAWQTVFTALRNGLPEAFPPLTQATPGLIRELLDHARLSLAEMVRRQTTETLVNHMTASNRLGLMTSQLLASTGLQASADILAQHLPHLGIPQALVGTYSHTEEDPLLYTQVLLAVGYPERAAGLTFLTRQFPPPELISPDQTYRLAILPLVIDENNSGFAAFNAANLENCAAIVHNLASALRTSQLYQDALRGRQMAEEANQLKSRFLSIVGHELRTPLSLIIGLSEMVLRDAQELSEAARHDLEQIHSSAQHLSRLVGDVLDLASSEAGQLRILREPLDLVEVLRVAARVGEQLARQKGIAWQDNLPQHSLWVLGDRTRLRQVTLNLISNAVKFTPQGKVLLELKVSGQQAVVSVSDTGIGISPAEQESIFDEFRRSERSIQSGYSGLGLGLTISRELVAQHGGSMGVRSPGDLGSGATFYFTLPILTTSDWQEADPFTAVQKNAVIVLVEETGRAQPLCDYLRQQGFDVQLWSIQNDSGWLSKISALRPAAVVLDNDLAVRQGWTIFSLLKRQPATADVPVFAYALDLEGDRGELLELNYLNKPLSPEQLAAELRRYFGTAPQPGDGQRTVLLVDDDPAVLDLHRRLVEEAGCRTVMARNGKEALDMLKTVRPDLILLDLMMPELDGFAVLDELRSWEATRDIPVIILTARTLSEAELESCNRGVASILTKGLFSAGETLRHIEAALTRQQSLSLPTQRLVRQAMGFIHSHYAEPLTREDIAQCVGISADYLTDCFRQELGITPITYLRRYRIRQACDLLKNTDLTITQIAMAVGFSESAHFSRTFHRETGLTPRAYRRSHPGSSPGDLRG